VLGVRKICNAVFKAEVALEAVKGEKSVTQIALDFGARPNHVRLLAVLAEFFSHRRPQEEKSHDELEADLYRQISQLKVEVEWPKKISKATLELKRAEVELHHSMISVSCRCNLFMPGHPSTACRWGKMKRI
jgi:putative transposase